MARSREMYPDSVGKLIYSDWKRGKKPTSFEDVKSTVPCAEHQDYGIGMN